MGCGEGDEGVAAVVGVTCGVSTGRDGRWRQSSARRKEGCDMRRAGAQLSAESLDLFLAVEWKSNRPIFFSLKTLFIVFLLATLI